MSLVWQSPEYSGSLRITHVIARRPAADVAIRFSLAPTLGELAAKPTERVKFALSAPFRGTSPIGRGKTLIRLQKSSFYAASA